MNKFDQTGRKKICFITTLPITLKTFVRPQAEYLIQNGWDVTWICASDSHLSEELPSSVKYIPLLFKRGIDPFGLPRAIINLFKIFKRERFDIVQYSTPNAAFYSSTAAWLARIPVRLYAQWGIRYVGFEGIKRHFFKLLEKWCCRCSTIIEPDSISNLEFSIKQGLYSKSKGRLIWNGSACGVDLERFDITKKEEWRQKYRQQLGLDRDHLVIGFVGSIRRDKGVNELLTACQSFFKDIFQARLLLIGDKQFYDTIDKYLRDWVASSTQVVYIPPNTEIPQYLACMDVFSMPSYREGFGLVIVEAEAMGVPVVVSDIPGPIDAMRQDETGFVVPVKNFKELSLALQNLLNDKVKRFIFGKNAVEYARQNFEQKKFLSHVLDDKKSLLINKC